MTPAKIVTAAAMTTHTTQRGEPGADAGGGIAGFEHSGVSGSEAAEQPPADAGQAAQRSAPPR